LADNYQAIHFYDNPIEPVFDTPPAREKSPDCPNGFIWDEKTYRVIEMLSSWSDFARRGKMARNMRPAHAAVASSRGSLNVGRFYFRVLTDTNQVFDIYYDRAIKNIDERKGQWFIYRELEEKWIQRQKLNSRFQNLRRPGILSPGNTSTTGSA
jgi:hypothetical protein